MAPKARRPRPKKSTTSKSRFKVKVKSSPPPKIAKALVKNKTLSNAGTTSLQIDLHKFNQGPLSFRCKKTFQYNSYWTLSLGALTNSFTAYWSLMSPYDPDYTNIGSNLTTPYWLDFVNTGTTNTMYKYYRVDYVEVQVKVISASEGKFPMLVYSANNLGTNSYGASQYIHTIAARPGHYGEVLEYNGDTSWVVRRFRLYPHKCLNISKRQYYDNPNYRYAYNNPGSVGPWFQISIGDGMSGTGGGVAQSVAGEISIDYHVTLEEPNLLSST